MSVVGLVLLGLFVLAGPSPPQGSQSYVCCRVSGGNIPIKATVTKCFEQRGVAGVSFTSEPLEGPPRTATARIPAAVYAELWEWIDSSGVWELPDVRFRAEDAATYRFGLSCGGRHKTITAISVSTLSNKTYYDLYKKLTAIRALYLPEAKKGGN